MKSVVDHLERWASEQPDRLALAFVEGDGRESEVCTYRQLRERTRGVARHLAQCGFAHGDRALLVYPPGLDFTVAFLACARLGVIPVPLPAPAALGAASALERVTSIAADCGGARVLAPRAFCNQVADSHELRWFATDGVDDAPGTLPDDPGEILFLQYTSGSTGDPRGVVVSHANVLANAAGTVDDVPVAVSWLPHFHDMGLIGYQLFPLLAGGTAYCLSPLSFLKRPALWLQTISRVRATRTSSPNFGFEYCLRPGKISPEQLQGLDLRSLRVLMNAAEPVCSETYERFVERFAPHGLDPCAATAAYGLAENTLAVTHGGRRSISVHSHLLAKSIVRPALGGANLVQVHSCGRPIPGVDVRIVDPDPRCRMPDGSVGEIWVSGASVCRGYWNRPAESAGTFENALSGDSRRYLRTGDLGFLDGGELFVCGRTKEVIIVRGVNHYPRDIEAAVLSAAKELRPAGAAAFQGAGSEALVVVAEARNKHVLPDPELISRAVRSRCSIEPDAVIVVPPRTIARTTSGKTARTTTRDEYLDGTLPILTSFRAASRSDSPRESTRKRFDYVLSLADSSLGPDATFGDLGLDSLLLTELLIDLEELLEECGEGALSEEIDLALLQHVPYQELFRRLESLGDGRPGSAAELREYLKRARQTFEDETAESMRVDSVLRPADLGTIELPDEPIRNVLLTGPTGFFGPFLLERLLRDTTHYYYALTRTSDPEAGMRRVQEALRSAGLLTSDLRELLERRVRIVCGDIAKPNLGLASELWAFLARETHAVIHNAALVNYVLGYDAMRAVNVEGTRTLLRFAHTDRRKEFHHVSTTFVFGWTVQGLVTESDSNEGMRDLDFGYSQTKWVAEHLVRAAGQLGIPAQIYRPSLISTSSRAAGDEGDVLIRLLTFMINHGVAVDSQNQLSIVSADVAAANIVAIFREQRSLGRTFNVTVDDYYNIADLTRVISETYGYPLTHYDIPRFLAEMNRRCKSHEPLYPLLPFFNRSAGRIAAMQLKRYGNDAYREMRSRSASALSDPTLEETASWLVTFMQNRGLIASSRSAPAGRSASRPSGPRATSRSEPLRAFE